MAEPITGFVLPVHFSVSYTLHGSLLSAYSIFVPVIKSEIRVRTHRQTALNNTNFWPCAQRPLPYCATITSGTVLGSLKLKHAVWLLV